MRQPPKGEGPVKELAKEWFKARKGWSYAPVQTGYGEHGIHDRVGCVPLLITQDMVGLVIGEFVSIECKAPGRRSEPRRGMSVHDRTAGNGIGCQLRLRTVEQAETTRPPATPRVDVRACVEQHIEHLFASRVDNHRGIESRRRRVYLCP